jgi:ParB family chromosome partitioning protein
LDDPRAPLRSAVDQGALDELMQSMSRRGLLQAIGVMERDGRFEVVWGHRRTMAARELGWDTIPARVVVRDAGGLLLDRAHENLMRADLSPVEEGQLCEALIADNGGDIERAARSIGRSVGWVDARLDLLRWPEDVRTAVDAGQISRAAGKPLSGVSDDKEREWLLRHAISDGATERVTRAWFQAWQLSGHIADPGQVGPMPRGIEQPLADPTIPCFFCQQVDSLGRMTYYWIHPVCANIIAANRPGPGELTEEVVEHAHARG